MTLDPDQTRYTLLHRALDIGDEDAWEQLVEHYRRFIYYILNQLLVNSSDIDDICQQVLLTLTKDLKKFDPAKGKFRSWLSTVIRNTAISYFRKQTRHTNKLAGLRNETVEENLQKSSEIDELIEQEWTTYIATQAMERVKGVFEGKAIEVFELSLDGLGATEIAEQTGLTLSSVYTLKKRVKKRLCMEIMDLTSELEP